MEIIEVSRKYINRILNGLDSHMVPGPDEISPYKLKMCADTLDKKLESPFKMLLERDKPLKEWKRANVIPIYKKGDWEEMLILSESELMTFYKGEITKVRDSMAVGKVGSV